MKRRLSSPPTDEFLGTHAGPSDETAAFQVVQRADFEKIYYESDLSLAAGILTRT